MAEAQWPVVLRTSQLRLSAGLEPAAADLEQRSWAVTEVGLTGTDASTMKKAREPHTCLLIRKVFAHQELGTLSQWAGLDSTTHVYKQASKLKKISVKASISAKTRRASRCLQRRNTFRHVYSQCLLENKSQSKKKNQEKKIIINTQTTIRDHYQIRQIKEFSLLILEISFKNVKDTSSSSWRRLERWPTI